MEREIQNNCLTVIICVWLECFLNEIRSLGEKDPDGGRKPKLSQRGRLNSTVI